MIKRIKKIDNRGIFKSYVGDATLEPFNRYNIFYGLNGSGKSTLSSLFRDIEMRAISEKFPLNTWELEIEQGQLTHENIQNHVLNLRVFNTDFVNDNIFTPNGVKGIVYISAKDTEDKKKLEQKKIEKQDVAKKQQAIIKELKGDPNNKKDKGLSVTNENFLTDAAKRIKSKFKIIDVADTRLLNYDKTKLRKYLDDNNAAIKDRKNILPANEIDKLTKGIKPQNKSEVPFDAQSWIAKDFLDKVCARVNELLQQSITDRSIQRLKDNTALSQWVHQGLQEFHTPDSNICEFCGQVLPPSRIQELNAHFSDEFSRLQATIDKALNWLTTIVIFPDFPHSSLLYDEFGKEYDTLLNNIKTNTQPILDVISIWKDALIEKKANPFRNPDMVHPVNDESYNQAKSNFDSIIAIISSHNTKFHNLEKVVAEAKSKLELHYVAEEIASYDYYTNIAKEEKLKKDERDLAYEIDAMNISIREIQARLSDEKFGEKEFNEKLHHFLGRDDLTLSHQDGGSYLIKRPDGSTADNKTLSEGEKTAIGLVYFLTKLRENGNKIEDTIVVLDDPISSFDSDHLFHANYFIEQECIEAKQLLVFTHNFKFMQMLKFWMKSKHNNTNTKCNMYYIKPVYDDGRKGNIHNCNKIIADFNSEYHWLFHEILEFTKNPKNDYTSIHTVANLCRQLLESFLSFKYGKWSFDKAFSFIDGFADINKVKKFVHYYSHRHDYGEMRNGFNENLISEPEKIVPLVLELVKHVDKTHYDSIIAEIQDA